MLTRVVAGADLVRLQPVLRLAGAGFILLVFLLQAVNSPGTAVAASAGSLRIGHASGRCGSPCLPAQQWANYLASDMKNNNLDLLTTTETVEGGVVQDVKSALGSGFTIRKVADSSSEPNHNAREYMFISRDSILTPSSSSPTPRQLSTEMTGSDEWRDPFASEQTYKVTGSDHSLHVYDLHAPSSVDGGSDYKYQSNPHLVVASQQGFRNMGSWVANADTDKSIDIVNMDSNVDWKKPAWRQRVLGYMSEGGAKASSIWDSNQPSEGTHAGARLIDVGVIYHTTSSASSVLNDSDPSDHKAIMYTIAFPGAVATPGGSSSSSGTSAGNDCSPSSGSCVTCSNGQQVDNTFECPATDPAATSTSCAEAKNCDLVTKYVNPFINLLSALIGVVVVIAIVVGGIQYSAAGGDPQTVALAKQRIMHALIALLVFIFLYALLNFLIPGGLL